MSERSNYKVGEAYPVLFYVGTAATPVTGLVDGDFTSQLFQDGVLRDASGDPVVVVTEVDDTEAPGWYLATYTPDAVGYWVAVITDGDGNIEDPGFMDEIQVYTNDLDSAIIDYVLAYPTAGQSLVNNTETTVAFGSEVANNVGATLHDNSTNNSRFKAIQDGRYLFQGVGDFGAHATGERILNTKKNGVSYLEVCRLPASAARIQAPWAIVFMLDAGDYVELTAKQDSGGAFDFGSGGSTWAVFTYLGPKA